MTALYVTEPNDEGMVAVITDDPCSACGWPETVLHVWPDRETHERGCPSCETVWGGLL